MPAICSIPALCGVPGSAIRESAGREVRRYRRRGVSRIPFVRAGHGPGRRRRLRGEPQSSARTGAWPLSAKLPGAGGRAPGWELADGRGCGVDFALSAEQRELTQAAADFARRELNRDLVKREDAGEFPREAWQACAKFGIQGLPVPAELGGAGSDVVTT